MKKQKINLYLASPRGFCAGVDRAVKIVEETIKKFGALADHLLKSGVVKKFYIPKECSTETMKTSHSLDYINDISASSSNFWSVIFIYSSSSHLEY